MLHFNCYILRSKLQIYTKEKNKNNQPNIVQLKLNILFVFLNQENMKDLRLNLLSNSNGQPQLHWWNRPPEEEHGCSKAVADGERPGERPGGCECRGGFDVWAPPMWADACSLVIPPVNHSLIHAALLAWQIQHVWNKCTCLEGPAEKNKNPN